MSKGSKRRPGKGYDEGYDRIWGRGQVAIDPADYDICDEHEAAFPKGDDCPECVAREAAFYKERQESNNG